MDILITPGTEKLSKKRGIPIAIIPLSHTTIFVLEGKRGDNPNLDIVIKYKKNNNDKILTPSHIHWVVDFIIKLESNDTKTINFIRMLHDEYVQTNSLVGRDRTFQTISDEIVSFIRNIDINLYTELNGIGYYDIDFLIVLIKLFSIAEKTSRPNAYKFRSLLNEFTKPNPDYFSIVAVAADVRGAII